MRDTKIRERVRTYISRKRWKRKEKNARYVSRVRMRDVSVREISRRRNIWEGNCVKGEEYRIGTVRSLLFVGIRLRKLHLLRGGKDQGGNKVAGRSAGRIRGNPCRTKFAIERSSRWRFMSCRDRLLVTPWIVDGYPCGKPHTRHYPGATMSRGGWNREAILCHKRVETVSRILGIDASSLSL